MINGLSQMLQRPQVEISASLDGPTVDAAEEKVRREREKVERVRSKGEKEEPKRKLIVQIAK